MARPATTWKRRTAREPAAPARARPALASASTRGELRPRGASGGTGLGTARGGCRGGQGELPPPQPPIGKMQMLAKALSALHLLCLPCPLETIFLA